MPTGRRPYEPYTRLFDIEIDNIHRKACLVSGDYINHIPDTITYSSVVTREAVRITLTMAVLQDVEGKAADVFNNYLMAPNRKKIWTVLL